MCREAFALADVAGARAPWVTSGTNWMLSLFFLGRPAEARDVALQLLAREAWLLPASVRPTSPSSQQSSCMPEIWRRRQRFSIVPKLLPTPA